MPPPPPKPKPKIVVPPPPPEPDFMEENGPLVMGGGAVLALLFGWLGFSAYRKKRAAAAGDATISAKDLTANSVFSSTSVAPPPSEQEPSQFSATGIGLAGHQETVDPVVEADTFLAFGRDAQAEEVLLDALEKDPKREAVHMKLLDIYSARKNTFRFQAVAQDLHNVTGGIGANWEKAAAMGAALDPENALFASAKPAQAEEAPAEPPGVESTQILSAAALAAAAPGASPEPAAAESPAAPKADEGAALDFDLDMGTEPAAAAHAPAAAVDHEAALDFDLDLGTGQEVPAEAAPAAPAEVAALDISFEMPGKEAPAPALDFPVAAEAPAEAPAAAAEAPAAPAAADPNMIEFNFDLTPPEAPAEAPAPAPAVTAEAPALELGGISLDLEAPKEAAVEAAPVAPAADDNPEVTTKLELAAAYEEMGDRDGARELYQEALNEGGEAQKELARAKLASLA